MTQWFDQAAAGRNDVSVDDYLGGDARGTQANSLIVANSGNAMINGLLSGVRWNVNAGNNFQLSIAVTTSPLSYGANYGDETNSWSQLTQAQINAFSWAVRLIEDYTRLDFVPGNEATANIRLANVQGRSHGYYPTGHDSMGDVWMGNLNDSAPGNGVITNPILGGFNFATHLHELGHAIGLKHGQDNGGPNQQANGTPIPHYAPLPAQFDNWNWSLMTYRSYTGASPDPVQGVLGSDNPITFMPLDIQALQYMYGAEYGGTSSGNTVYHWDNQGFFSMNGQLPAELSGRPAANGKVLMTVWDGGGNDTYDFSSFSVNQRISLVPGAFSTFNQAQVADLDRNHPGVQAALGNVANAFLFNNDLRSLIENAIAGSGNDVMVGNQGPNTLVGNGGNDDLTGGAGIDTLNGGPGNDIYRLGSDTQDGIIDASGIDTVYSTIGRSLVPFSTVDRLVLQGNGNLFGTGNALNNIIWGTPGNNVLDGGAGTDTLIGGLGNDTYALSNGTDVVNDTGGTADLITSSITRSLAGYAAIEKLTLLGSASIAGVGNALNNVITGNGGNNGLNGAGGNDTLNGGAGNDSFTGGSGLDTLNGGPGNDTYHLGAESDAIIDASGIDSITTTITRNLASYAAIENLYLLGGAAINGTGNALANIIQGNTGGNVLRGGAANDILRGGLGTDSYYGDANDDRFRFAAINESAVGANRDVIFDFDDLNKGNDVIDLSQMAGVTTFIGTAAFTAAGQVRVQQAGPNVLIQINTAGTSGAECEILIVGAALGPGVGAIDASDFLL